MAVQAHLFPAYPQKMSMLLRLMAGLTRQWGIMSVYSTHFTVIYGTDTGVLALWVCGYGPRTLLCSVPDAGKAARLPGDSCTLSLP